MLACKVGMTNTDAPTALKEITQQIKGQKGGWTWEEFKAVFDEDLKSKNLKWKKKLETKEKEFLKTGFKVTVHQRPGSLPTDLLRLDSEMRGIPNAWEKILDYFMHPPKEKMSMIKEMRELETYPDGGVVIYWRFKLPIMSDRDNICLIKRIICPDGGDYV